MRESSGKGATTESLRVASLCGTVGSTASDGSATTGMDSRYALGSSPSCRETVWMVTGPGTLGWYLIRTVREPPASM